MWPHFTFLSSECFCRLEYISHIYSLLNPLVRKILPLSRRTCFVAPFFHTYDDHIRRTFIFVLTILSYKWDHHTTKIIVPFFIITAQIFPIHPTYNTTVRQESQAALFFFINIRQRFENFTNKLLNEIPRLVNKFTIKSIY